MTFARDTKWRPTDKQKKSRFDSLYPLAGHWVPGGRRLSVDDGDSSEPASETVSAGSAESDGTAESNPGHSILRMLGHLPGKTVKRPSDAGLEPKLQARSRDGSRPTTGTADVNPGQAAHNLLKNILAIRLGLRRGTLLSPSLPVPVTLGFFPSLMRITMVLRDLLRNLRAV